MIDVADYEDWEIRLMKYRINGFPEKAKRDEDKFIRLEAYRSLGFTEEAKRDEDSDIRKEAELYFAIKNGEIK